MHALKPPNLALPIRPPGHLVQQEDAMQRIIVARALKALPSIACALTIVAIPALAQTYPSKPIRLVVPLAPGGPSDLLARTMAQQLLPALGQPVVVDNRTGAGGTIGIDIAAKSPADGYTMLLVASATYTITASLYPKLPYDARRDLTPVSILAGGAYLLTVHPSLPVKTLKELIALDKARPRDLNYGSGGTGTGPQMSMELLKLKTGMHIMHIPYKGTGPMLIDHIAGHVQVSLSNMIATLPVVESKRLRALAVSGAKRTSKMPDLPTLTESGVDGFDDVSGHMIMVPAATPKEIIARLHRELVKALQAPEVVARLEGEGADIIGSTPEQAAALVNADFDKWAEVIKRTGIKLE
jgi:tripartite-type tricarboxylate transporter receptor subunit TctC